MRVVVLAPRRKDYGRRDHIWSYVRRWIEEQHPDYEVYEGYDTVNEVFSMATARNNAARDAGTWDVAVIQDSDTISDPLAVQEAVAKASLGTRMWIPGDIRMCLSEKSSNRMLSGGLWFPRPDGHLPKNGANESVYGEPAGSIVAVSRALWDSIGGYLECLQGWGYEDLIFFTCAQIFGDGVSWIPDSIMYHFWHERSRLDDNTQRNYQIWQNLENIKGAQNAQGVAKEYLQSLGHSWNLTS